MSIGDNTKILNYMYRTEYNDAIYDFEEIIKESILSQITSDIGKAEVMANTKLNYMWNSYMKIHDLELESKIVPIFDIVDEYSKKVSWIGVNDSKIEKSLKPFYKIRPALFKYIDRLDDREYEILACIICEFLGAQKILLTDKGNEGGIDFFAQIQFSETAHFLFGLKGPIRIVGQCKKYATRANASHMKEFLLTLNNVYNISYRAGEVIPMWFKTGKGPIIGWHISHEGHQSGALDYAKNYGVIVSDSKELVEVLCKSKAVRNMLDIDKISYINSKLDENLYST